MMRLSLSSAASGLLRALIVRAHVPRDRVLLTSWRSTDWQSLTFVGERHEVELRITGPDAAAAAQRLLYGLGDAEFTIPGQIIADIAIVGDPRDGDDGSVTIGIEALTIVS